MGLPFVAVVLLLKKLAVSIIMIMSTLNNIL